MSYIFTAFLAISLICAAISGNGAALASATAQGAQAGITLAISLAGSLCLWTALGQLMEKIGLTKKLSRLLHPLLRRLFPSVQSDSHFACNLSANICANLLGLGNAATPTGIEAAKALAKGGQYAGSELCRLIVLNTASIQLIPATVAALRANLGAASPYSILPAVWITSLCSAAAGLTAAWFMEKLWRS